MRGRRAEPHLLEIAPAHLELIGVGHVGHRAAGGEVGEDHLLMIGAQHVGALRHEVHAAEDDELGVGMPADLLRELVGVAGVVGELDHFVALVVMAEDDQRGGRAWRLAAAMRAIHLLVGQAEVPLRQRLALARCALFRRRSGHRQQHECPCALVKLFSSSAREKAKLRRAASRAWRHSV